MFSKFKANQLRKALGKIGLNSSWDTSVLFKGDLREIYLDNGFLAEKNAVLENHTGGKIQIGHSFRMGYSALILSHGGKIEIGHHCSLNPFSILYGHGNLKIGDYVRIAAHTVVIPANHIFEDPNIPITRQGLTKEGIEIGNDVWIGARCVVLDGIKIGDGSVIGAGSIVTTSIPPFSVAVGAPAKIVSKRSKTTGEPR